MGRMKNGSSSDVGMAVTNFFGAFTLIGDLGVHDNMGRMKNGSSSDVVMAVTNCFDVREVLKLECPRNASKN